MDGMEYKKQAGFGLTKMEQFNSSVKWKAAQWL